jgi:adenylate kinase
MPYVVLLGAPGAGKGTQAVNLAEQLGVAHIATGDLFRQAMAQGTPLGKQAKAYVEKGALVPNELTIQMVLERIAAPDCVKGVVFDGFPRTMDQAKALDEALAKQAKKIDKVVYIKVAEDALIKRLSGRWICRKCQAPYHSVDSPPKMAGICDRCSGELYQRADDTPETVKKRLVVFAKETAPLVDYYNKTGKLVEVEGEGSVAEVGKRIIAAVKRSKATK